MCTLRTLCAPGHVAEHCARARCLVAVLRACLAPYRLAMSRHQKPCLDIPATPLCRDTKKCVTTPKFLTHVATPKSCVATPLQPIRPPLCCNAKQWVTTPRRPTMSRPQEVCRDTVSCQPGRDTKKCVATLPCLAQVVCTPSHVAHAVLCTAAVLQRTRSASAWTACQAQPSRSRHHLLCHDRVLEMGSSPFQLLPCIPIFFSFWFYPL